MHLRGSLYAFFVLITAVLQIGCGSDSRFFTVSNLAPYEVTAGSNDFSLLISGYNFNSNTKVLFGSLTLIPGSVRSDLLQVTVPASAVANAGVVDVAVTGSSTSATLKFTIKNPLPAISGLSQSEVMLNSTSVSLDITGSKFVSTSTVNLGDTILKPSSFTSTHLTVAVPDALLATAQILNLSVANPGPGGGSSSPITFSVLNPAPAVAALSMESTLLNSTSVALDVTGANFLPSSVVTLGSTPLTPTAVSPTQLTVALPDALLTTAQVLGLAVVNPGPGGGASSRLDFTVLNPQPIITSLSAEEAMLNSTDLALVITGTGFAPGMKVEFGSMALDPSEITPTRAIVMIPATAFGKSAIQNVTVINGGPGGGTSNERQFTVKNPMPALASMSVTKMLVGSDDLTLNLTGSGFVSGESVVHFGSLTLTPTSTASDQLSVIVPKAALAQTGTVSVNVTTGEPGGGQSNALEFTVENPVPSLASLSLNGVTAGSAAFDLTLTGANFVQGIVVSVGGAQLTPAAVSGTQATVTVPLESLLDAGEYQVIVSNPGPGGGPSNALPFTIDNPQPTLTAISPSSAIRLSTNTTLTLTGSGFVHQSAVLFGTTTLVPSAYTATAITVTVPSTALSKTGRVDVSVVNPGPGGGTSNITQVAVSNPTPELSSASPSSISISTSNLTVVLSGTGFNEDTVVKMTSSASGTVILPVASIEPTAITLSIPAADLASAGTLVFSTENPGPGGGNSVSLDVIVHERAAADWQTVVNNQTNVPDGSGTLFNSYNQPSISNYGTVVFKGQSKGNSGPTVGVYLRDMSCARGKSCGGNMSGAGSLQQLTGKGMSVPQPNNTLYNGSLAGFNEFPSFPRIDMDTEAVAVRGQSKPTWTFTTADGLESRIGSAGIFTTAVDSQLKTAVGLLGTVPGFEYFKVPSEGGTRFDQFPGSPAIYHNYVIFKGNYTVGDLGKTGVYYRDVVPDKSGDAPVERPVFKIADSDTIIPNQPDGGSVTFGSTAPPSAADGKMVFLGLDNEDAPTMGGIYLATLPAPSVVPDPAGLPLIALVTVGANGTQVPGEPSGVTFSRLSEGLSFDGRYVGFWGAWGTATRTRHLYCGVDGNTDMLAACNNTYPNGFDTEIPVHQGIFVYDTQNSENPLHVITKSDSGEFSDFMFWVFSGRPPNVGGGSGSDSGSGAGSSGSGGAGSEAGGGDSGGDSGTGDDVVPEPPRFRWSAFVAVEGGPGAGPDHDLFKVAFKARAGTTDGVYLAQSSDLSRIQTVVDTATSGSQIDINYAPADSVVATVGVERDGLRNDQLVITASMLNSVTTESNAGVYVTPIETLLPPPPPQN